MGRDEPILNFSLGPVHLVTEKFSFFFSQPSGRPYCIGPWGPILQILTYITIKQMVEVNFCSLLYTMWPGPISPLEKKKKRPKFTPEGQF